MTRQNKTMDIEKGSLPQASTSDLRRSQFAIQGMTCTSCSSAIQTNVEPLDGIVSVQVHFISNQAIVIYQPAIIDGAQIREIIEDTGYGAILFEDAKLEAEDLQPFDDTRTIDIEIRSYNDPSFINERLGRLGLLSFTPVTTTKNTSEITYRPSRELTIRHILDFPAPITAHMHQRTSIHVLSREYQRREFKKLSCLLVLDFFIAIPTFIIGVVGMSLLPPSNEFRVWCEDLIWGGSQRAVVTLFVLSTLSQLLVNQYFVVKAGKSMKTTFKTWHWTKLFSFGSMDLLVALSTTIAYFASLGIFIRDIFRLPEDAMSHGSSTYFDSNIFLGLFILAGKVLEHYARSKSTDAIAKLEGYAPDSALLVSSQEIKAESDLGNLLSSPTKSISADLVEIGDLILLPAGRSPPADGIVVAGSSAFDESSLTGESLPVNKRAGDAVMTGTKNLASPVVCRVHTVGQETMMRKIIRVVAEGQTKKSPIQLLAERITSVFVPLIVYLSLIVLIVWLSVCLSVPTTSWVLPPGQTATSDRVFLAFQFVISALVIACPCGIGLAAPTAQAVGSGLLAKAGILAQGGGEAFQLASSVDIVVFDKTGTLTRGEASVAHTHQETECDDWLWDAIKTTEASSTHPLAQAIVSYCQGKQNISRAKLIDCEEMPGEGVRSTFSFEDRTVRFSIGSEEFILRDQAHFDLPIHLRDIANSWRELGDTVVFVMKNDSDVLSVPIMFGIADQIRPNFKEIIANLRASGKWVYMLTGDNPRTALAVARKLGINEVDNIKAGVLPLEKAEFIKKLKQQNREHPGAFFGCLPRTKRQAIVAFVGDGLNDSAAIAAADVGIALAHGSDVSIASASFVVLSNSVSIPHSIEQLFKISSRVFHRQILNFGWAMLYNAALIPVAAGVLYPYRRTQLSPVWSALAMALSSVSVVLSSLALKWGI